MGNCVKLLFLGDFLLSDGFLKHAQFDPGWNPFADPALVKLAESHDIVIGSLDCAMGNGEKPIGADRIIVRTGASAISTLRHLKMGLVTLATNHAFDFGLKGFQSTQAELSDQDIRSVGAGHTLSEAAAPLITEIDGTRIAWIAAADPATSAVMATQDAAGVNPIDPISALEAQIRQLRQSCDVVIFLPHWGTEWYKLPSPKQRRTASRLVQAGVDLVIGNHPHVTQAFEFIDGKAVFYALGNAVVTDITETGVEPLKQLLPNLKSLAASVHVTATGDLLRVKVWDLCYQQGQNLVVCGDHRPSLSQETIRVLWLRGRVYTALWILYCVFMESLFIPVRYRLLGYGLKYVLKRVNLKTVWRRMRLLSQRAFCYTHR